MYGESQKEERERRVNEKLRQVIRYAYENAPAIKERFDQAGVDPSQISTVKDLERVPILTKEELITRQKANPPFGGFLAVPMEEIQKTFFSPGPVYVPYRFDESFEQAVKALEGIGYGKGDSLITTLHPMLFPTHLMDDISKALGVTVIPMGPGNTDLLVQVMHFLKVTTFNGTPSFLMNVIRRAEEQGYNFRKDFALRIATLGAEKLPLSTRRSLEEDYGLKVMMNYGTADVAAIGLDCIQASGYHILDEMVIVEIVDTATGKQLGPGEPGEVVVTPLRKYYPLIRYATGDLSYYSDEPCPCGNPANRLVDIVGRVGDSVKVRGLFVHPGQVGEVISSFREVSRFQLVVGRIKQRDELIFRLELEDEGVNKESLSQSLLQKFQEVCRVRADKIEFVAKATFPEDHKTIVDERIWE
jgi:phenylacetate-CoA ligase